MVTPSREPKRYCRMLPRPIIKNIISLRYFNPVGAHTTALIGELPTDVLQNLVPFVTQSAAGKRGAITVFGNDYNTADGSCIRDYIHVVDLAEAHIAALQLLEKGNSDKNYDVFNIGTGMGYSVLELIRAFEETTGVKLNYQIGPRRAGDIVQVWGDVTKSKNVLGWKANLGIQGNDAICLGLGTIFTNQRDKIICCLTY
jgi:UDP-glucose 4-epimerase